MHQTGDNEAALDAIADLIGAGRAVEAEAAAAALLGREPSNIEAMRLRAVALLQQQRIEPAREALVAALRHAPDSVELLCNLGSAELARDDARAAIAALERAFAIAPSHPAVLLGLGNARRAAGDLEGARDAYAAATRADARHAGAWLNLAAVELALGRSADAERDARRALALEPGHPHGLMLLGNVLAVERRYAEAEAAYEMGARAAPNDARFPYQAALMAEEQGRLADAAALHARSLALDASLDSALSQLVFLKRQLGDWNGLDALSDRLRARVAAGARGIAPFAFLSEPAGADEQLQCARTAAAAIESAAAPLRRTLAWQNVARDAAPDRLRVGFVSNGFGDHPTGLLIVAMIEAIRDERIDAVMFATSPDDGGAIRRRLRAASAEWHEVDGLALLALASRMHEAKLDLLIDLRGYGGGSVAEALALRPAPMQIGWLAYPGTSGAPWIDYVIADDVVLPANVRAHFSEAVATLPRCFQPSDATREIPDPPSRADCGLPPEGPVFVSFNNRYKLNPRSMQRMFAVLRAVPDATLWLLAAREGADDRLRAAARDAGVDPARLAFMPKLPHAEYLARYRHADLFLDTTPYNAHTTASDAIWAGCPVLTTPGATFAARVAASLNAYLGISALNVADDAAFVETAVRIGRDGAFRAALRAEVAERRSSSGLFDMRGFARDFAALLWRIADRHRRGLAPADMT
ncbi:MAG TPA: tetratricopeptide repeat protein [Rhodanobacteraceae bacterium]|nr:tetratricopeptide repeat protein [Rhodanobacteraceae bacterium]